MDGRRRVNTVSNLRKRQAPVRSAAVNTLLQEDEVFGGNLTGQTPTPKCLQDRVEAHDWNMAYNHFGEFKLEFGVRKKRKHLLTQQGTQTKKNATRKFGIKDCVAFHSHHAAYGLGSLLEVYDFLLLEKSVLVWYVCDVIGVYEWREAKVLTLTKCKDVLLTKDQYLEMNFEGQDYMFHIKFLDVNEMFRHEGAYVEKNFIKVQDKLVSTKKPCACVDFRNLTWGQMYENQAADKILKWIPIDRVSDRLKKDSDYWRS